MSKKPKVYVAKCLCGGVTVEVTGRPMAAGLCHCESCRTWHAAPINAFATWPGEAVRVTEGEALLANYRSGNSNRHWCRNCGSGMINRLSDRLTVVYAMALAGSGYVHKPTCHIHCDEAVLDIHDGLPKYLDMPAEWGGSGETVEEPSRTGMHLSSAAPDDPNPL